MKIAFVILNYNTYEETVECVNSIEQKIDTDGYRIVIVDNASKDSSFLKLQNRYKDSEKIEILQTDENLGFAKGNNLGIQYANKKYQPEFMVVLNSDTELIQYDLYSKLEAEYRKSEFALLGPLILTLDGRCDNSPHFPPKYETVSRELARFKQERKILHLGLYKPYAWCRKLVKFLCEKIRKTNRPSHRNMDFHQYQQQVVLQGSFLVFSQKAFAFIDGFVPDTFLYYEEPILYLELMKHNLRTVYNPEICIYHKDSRATSTIVHSNRKRLLFINQCYQDSAKVLLHQLEAGNRMK